MGERITTEEAERIAESLEEAADAPIHHSGVSALRALAAERDELARSLGLARTDAYQRGYAAGKTLAAGRDALDRALRKATWDLANFTFRGKDTSLGEEAERQYRAALGEEDDGIS